MSDRRRCAAEAVYSLVEAESHRDLERCALRFVADLHRCLQGLHPRFLLRRRQGLGQVSGDVLPRSSEEVPRKQAARSPLPHTSCRMALLSEPRAAASDACARFSCSVVLLSITSCSWDVCATGSAVGDRADDVCDEKSCDSDADAAEELPISDRCALRRGEDPWVRPAADLSSARADGLLLETRAARLGTDEFSRSITARVFPQACCSQAQGALSSGSVIRVLKTLYQRCRVARAPANAACTTRVVTGTGHNGCPGARGGRRATTTTSSDVLMRKARRLLHHVIPRLFLIIMITI